MQELPALAAGTGTQRRRRNCLAPVPLPRRGRGSCLASLRVGSLSVEPSQTVAWERALPQLLDSPSPTVQPVQAEQNGHNHVHLVVTLFLFFCDKDAALSFLFFFMGWEEYCVSAISGQVLSLDLSGPNAVCAGPRENPYPKMSQL